MSKTKSTQADSAFRKLLKELRMAKNFSQIELAARLGMPQSYVSKYETGERRLDFVETVLVCEALEIGIQEFAKAFCSKLIKPRRVRAKRLK